MHISLYGKSAGKEYETLIKLYRVYKKNRRISSGGKNIPRDEGCGELL